ncbi:hypothetical protein [Akkermansia massiliensis]
MKILAYFYDEMNILSKFKFFFTVIGFLFFIFNSVFISYSEELNKGLEIYSETEKNSARVLKNNGDRIKDLERTSIGIGEKVSLTLGGKLLDQVDRESIEWIVEGDKDLIKLNVMEWDKVFADFSVKCAMKKEKGQVTIKVKTNLEDISPTIKFTIYNPTDISARHSGLRDPDYPMDGDKSRWGASTALILEIAPMNVSFSGIFLIERANDGEGSEVPFHETNPEPSKIDKYNEVRYDYIGGGNDSLIPYQPPRSLPQPAEFDWKCSWYTYVDGNDCWRIGKKDYKQHFKATVGKIDPERPQIRNICVEVSKFGCTVKRSTSGEAKHEDS